MAEKQPRSSWWWIAVVLPAGIGLGWLIPTLADRAPARRPDVTAPAVAGSPAPAIDAEPAATRRRRAPAAATVTEPTAPVRSNWTTMAAALEESKRNGKPILIDFNAEWCGPCRYLKREVFDNATHGRKVELAVIPVSIVDRRREDGSNPPDIEELQNRYDVDAFPTLVVWSPRTNRHEFVRGAGDPDEVVRWVQWAAAKVR